MGSMYLLRVGPLMKSCFFYKLKNCTSNPGSASCVMKGDNSWCSPNEFENLGGRIKSKYWKRSICYDGKPLLQCLAHLGLNDQTSGTTLSVTVTNTVAGSAANKPCFTTKTSISKVIMQASNPPSLHVSMLLQFLQL